MDLRFLGKVLQGALIGLGAVLPGISGGVLSVVFGVYRPIMELLADPLRKWKTHLSRFRSIDLLLSRSDKIRALSEDHPCDCGTDNQID